MKKGYNLGKRAIALVIAMLLVWTAVPHYYNNEIVMADTIEAGVNLVNSEGLEVRIENGDTFTISSDDGQETVDIDTEGGTISIQNYDISKKYTYSFQKNGYKNVVDSELPEADAEGNIKILILSENEENASLTVKDSITNEKLSDVSVTILCVSDNNDEAAKGTTNTDGTFSFIVDTRNKYTFSLQKDGYISQTSQSLTEYNMEVDLVAFAEDTTFAFIDDVTNVSVIVGETVTKTAKSTANSDAKITYESKNTDIATVNETTGEVTGIAGGTAEICAKIEEKNGFHSKEISYMITVLKKNQNPLVFKNEGNVTIAPEENSFENIASGGSLNETISYESSDENIAKVDNNGLVTKVASGTVRITAKMLGDSAYNDVSASYEITFQDYALNNFADSTVNIYVGQKKTIKADIKNSYLQKVKYSSNNNEIVSVDESTGEITALSDGNTVISAETQDWLFFKGNSKKYNVIASYLESSIDDVCSVSGAKDSNSDWYTSEVILTAKTGYQLSTDKTNWKDTILVTEDGISTVEFYAKSTSDDDTKDGITDKLSITIKKDTSVDKGEVSVASPKNNGKYNTDVPVKVVAHDSLSGLAKIEYWVTDDVNEINETQRGELSITGTDEVEKIITVQAEKNNTDYVTVHVKVTDILGNESAEEKVSFAVDIVKPTISVIYDNNDVKGIAGSKGFYTEARKAELVITERTSNFNTDNINSYIVLKKDNNVVDLSNLAWNTVEGSTPDEATHTAELNFLEEGEYDISYGFTDDAGNTNDVSIDYNASKTPNSFCMDWTKPTGSIYTESLGPWKGLLNQFNYNDFAGINKPVVITSEDNLSGVKNVQYMITSRKIPMTEAELDNVTTWNTYTSFVFSNNGKYVVYAKITDYAGNVTYISTDGLKIDAVSPNVEITLSSKNTIVYGNNVTAKVTVADPLVDEIASGVANVTYEVYSQGVKTQSGNLATAGGNIVIDKNLNNSNDVKVVVTAVDNKDNKKVLSKTLAIDTSAPQISVNYDNNSLKTNNDDGAFFDSGRTATIIIKERNFDEKKVTIKAVNSEGNAPIISNWTKIGGNGDNTQYLATVVFTDDGDYVLDVRCTDNGGNSSNGISYGDNIAPFEFTIDKTKPQIEVSYDNNSSVNGNYYANGRRATITIREHNFNPSGVVFTSSATDNGNGVSAPSIGTWSNEGDVHRTSVDFGTDALYTWNIAYTDKAGNIADSITQEEFYVDMTKPEIIVNGIENHSVNNSEGNIGFTVECTDTNFDEFNVKLASIKYINGKFEQGEEEGAISDIGNGQVFSIDNIAEDGIYTLTYSATDKAGNSYEDEGEFVFSVNRNGSTFNVGEKTADILNNYYIQSVDKDVEVIEVNADPLKSYSLTLNGNILSENADYVVTHSENDSEWNMYTYSVNKKLFENEGDYTLVVNSTDATDTVAYSDVKNLEVAFVVDKTAPTVTFTGLADNAIYQTDEQTVTAVVADDGGKVKSFKAVVETDDKEDVRFDMSDDELEEYLDENDGVVEFTLPKGNDLNVKVVCADYAVDSKGNTNEYVAEFKDIMVSEDGSAFFLKNKNIFVGIGCGVVGVALLGGIGYTVVRRKKA